MTLPYNRKFNVGRQSEQLYNEELHKIYESIRHLLDIPDNKHATPEAKLHGSLWLDLEKNELKYYDKPSDEWRIIFKSKFQIVDQITNVLPPDNPVIGQLWLYNDVLMYFDGAQWKPVKALEQDGSQFNISIFENFILASPVWTIGNTVLPDEDLEAYKEARKKYLQAKLDYANNNKYIETDKWKVGDPIEVGDSLIDFPEIEGTSQILIPNLNVDRMFLDEEIDFNYTEISKVCIEYPKSVLADKRPTVIHVNPGKLTKIDKKLIMVDRENPKINVSAHDTEYYGFHGDSIYGDLLLPEETQDDGGYITMNDGIYLSYAQAQNYDYVLAVHYEFSWYKSTGSLKVVNNNDSATSFYVQDYAGPITVFTDGYNLEETSFTEDNLSKVVTIEEDVTKIEDISMIHTVRREYGFVRKIDAQNRAVIKTLIPFKKPLIYLNGEALHPQLQDIEIDGNYIYIKNGQLNMTWGVVELYDSVHRYDMNLDTGYVRATDETGQVVINYDITAIDEEDDMILYIDGLLIKKEDMVRNHESGTISVNGLSIGQDYILLRDKYHYFYDENKLRPAIPVGHLSESLVYVNGNLINNDTTIATVLSREQMKAQAVHGEIKFFLKNDLDRTDGEFAYYDDPSDSWITMSKEKSDEVKSFCYSYENTLRSIKFNISIDKTDEIYIYAFNYANAIDETLVIRNIPSIYDDPNSLPYVENQKVFNIKESYIPNIGSLSVWVNGVRQYDVVEFKDGSGFELPESVTGVVTYVIENPEDGATTVAQREILTEENIVPNTVNVYRTKNSLYPGRVLFYVDGIRQPQSAFTILDNYTILVNDKDDMLIGNVNNYPNETIMRDDGDIVTVHHSRGTKILVEVKQDFQRKENFIKLNPDTVSDISISEYDLPIEILEAADEVMIFIDGLFMGLRKSFGYELDRYRGVISLGVRRDSNDETQDKTETTNMDVIQRIVDDPLYTFLESHPDKKLEYENKNGKPYEKKTRTVLFDWR